jgi:hypothetical protein
MPIGSEASPKKSRRGQADDDKRRDPPGTPPRFPIAFDSEGRRRSARHPRTGRGLIRNFGCSFDLGFEAIPASRDCFDKLGAVRSERTSELSHALNQCIVGYSDAWPYRIEELILRDKPPSITDKETQDRKRFRSERDLAIISEQGASFKIQEKAAKPKPLGGRRAVIALHRTEVGACDRVCPSPHKPAPEHTSAAREGACLCLDLRVLRFSKKRACFGRSLRRQGVRPNVHPGSRSVALPGE